MVVGDEIEAEQQPVVDLDTDPWSSDDPTEAIPVFRAEADDKTTDSDDFTFSFDDERR